MNDAENLHKLMTRAAPSFFKTALEASFGILLPEINAVKGKRRATTVFSETLSFLSVKDRQVMDEWAERINLLTDGPGKDAVNSIRQDKLPKTLHRVFDRLGNQYDRSLWLCINQPVFFHEAVNIRLADVFRQKVSCFTGFLGPVNRPVSDDARAVNQFQRCLSRYFGYPEDQMAITVFKRLHPDNRTGEAVALYQITIYHNLAPESVEYVKQGQLQAGQMIRAVSSFITYEPSTGYLDVLSKARRGREVLAHAAADCLLGAPVQGRRAVHKQYDYQCLSTPQALDITGEPVDTVRVIRLGYSKRGRTLEYRIGTREPEDIYTRAAQDIHPQFRFADHLLTMVWINVRIRRQQGERARSVNIILRGNSDCNIKAKREKDRLLCDRLLRKWGLVREVGNEYLVAANDA